MNKQRCQTSQVAMKHHVRGMYTQHMSETISQTRAHWPVSLKAVFVHFSHTCTHMAWLSNPKISGELMVSKNTILNGTLAGTLFKTVLPSPDSVDSVKNCPKPNNVCLRAFPVIAVDNNVLSKHLPNTICVVCSLIRITASVRLNLNVPLQDQ